MTRKIRHAALVLAAMAALSPAALSAQAAPQTDRDPNVGTETQERLAEDQTNDFDWGVLGLLGALGLLGLRRKKPTDWSSPR